MANRKPSTKDLNFSSMYINYDEAADRLRSKYPGRLIVNISGRPFACIPEDDCCKPAPAAARERDIDAIDLPNSRHTQALGVLTSVMVDLDGPQVLSTETVVANLWAVETLLTQAQEAGLAL